MGIPSGEVYPGRAAVRHEQGVPDKCRVTDHIGDTGRRVPGCMPGPAHQFTDLELVVVCEEAVELRAISLELRPLVEYLAEGFLHHSNFAADADQPSQRLL